MSVIGIIMIIVSGIMLSLKRMRQNNILLYSSIFVLIIGLTLLIISLITFTNM